MALVDKSVSVEKAPLDLMEQLAALVKAVKASGGFSVAAIPADIAALVAGLPAIVADCSALPGDFNENKLAFAKGVFIGAEELAEAALAKSA